MHDAEDGYRWATADETDAHRVLLAPTLAWAQRLAPGTRILDLGCGNGAVARRLGGLGLEVLGVDPSKEGIELARSAPSPSGVRFEQASAYDDLRGRFGTFGAVLSLEVVEHLYAPRDWARRMFDALDPGGSALVSTPYHGYWKNLVMAVTGKLDAHFTALWDHGHIKFWSVATLTKLVTEAGFEVAAIERVGRIPALAKSMVFTLRRPAARP